MDAIQADLNLQGLIDLDLVGYTAEMICTLPINISYQWSSDPMLEMWCYSGLDSPKTRLWKLA